MDITIETEKKLNWRYIKLVCLVLAVIAIGIWLKSYFGQATALVDGDNIRMAQVQRGQFQVNVRGIGVLKPKEIVWVSAQVSGRVEKVFVKAGAIVERNQPIVKLINPKLALALGNAETNLAKVKAENQAKQVSLNSELLDAIVSVKRAHMTYQGNVLEVTAQRKLKEMGNSSVSEINFQRTEFTAKSSKLDWELQQQRLANLKQNITAQKEAHAAIEKSLIQELSRAQDQLDNLVVRAGIEGVLQSMDLELGQEVSEGGSVGKIADPRNLLAQIDVQELQIKDVSLGQMVKIDTRKSIIEGEVSRISPQVEKGLVSVEVTLHGQLPSEARSELSVEGVINISDKSNALFVSKPAFAEDYQIAKLYRISPAGNIAEAVQVKFGQSSVNYIEIAEGLNYGDQIIISATDSFVNNDKVFLHN